MENVEMNAAAAVEMEKLCELLKDLDPILAKEVERAIVRARQQKELVATGMPELVDALKQWRRAKAKEEDVSAYIVLSNSVLLGIVQVMPATMEELLCVKGFGPAKAEKYGAEILQVVARECDVVPSQPP